MDAPEQVLLDENVLAGDSEYLNISNWEVSPDGTLLAWLEDRSGYEQNDLFVKHIETGELIGEPIRNLGPWSLAWASDNETLFYTRQDETNRPDRVYRRNINAPAPRMNSSTTIPMADSSSSIGRSVESGC